MRSEAGRREEREADIQTTIRGDSRRDTMQFFGNDRSCLKLDATETQKHMETGWRQKLTRINNAVTYCCWFLAPNGGT